MKIHALIIMLFMGFGSFAQDWTTLDHDPNAAGLEENPLKGFSTMWDAGNEFPFSIQGKLFGLNDVMNGIDDYDWSLVDAFLEEEAAKGKHVSLQFNIDPGIGATDLMDQDLGVSLIPDYLIDLVEWEYYTTTPEELAETGIPYYYCPDWNDADLMAAIFNFIDALGARYDGDDRIFIVQMGLYGMWGEWHIGDVQNVRPEFAMSELNKELMANAFEANFQNTRLVGRFPSEVPNPENFGYSDGFFFTESISEDLPWFFHNTLKDHNSQYNWMHHPIGGEITPGVQATIWDSWPNTVGQDVVSVLDSVRPTWLFSHFVLTDLDPLSAAWTNALNVQKMMGYTFHVDRFKLSAQNGNAAVEVNMKNLGIAPIYANWDVEFGVLDAADQFQPIGSTQWNIDLIQPDVEDNYRAFTSSVMLADGAYEVLMRVYNPMKNYTEDAPDLKFANASQDQDLEGWLSLGSANIVDGAFGTSPIAVTDFCISPNTATIQVSQSVQLTGNFFPFDASSQDVTWVSDDTGICLVDADGIVTGQQVGTCTISGFTNNGTITGQAQIVVEPYANPLPVKIEAEDYLEMLGIITEMQGDASGNIGQIHDGDWLLYRVSVEEEAEFVVDYHVASEAGVGQITLLDENDVVLHPEVGTPSINSSWFDYSTVTSEPFMLPAGEYNLKVYAQTGAFNLDWMEFRLTSGPDLVQGCTDPSYTEFNPIADTDDGSCATLVVQGCTYEAADNFNPMANVDDQSCTFAIGCDTDLDGDGTVDVGDLIVVLGAFGSTCD